MTSAKDLSMPLTVRKSVRARNVIFRMIPDKGLEVVIPPWVGRDEVPLYVERRREWIEMTGEKMRRKGLSLEPRPLVLPDEITFLASGRHYVIVRRRGGQGSLKVRRNVDRLHLSGSSWTDEQELTALRRYVAREAKAFLIPELRKVSRELNLPFEKVAVRSQRKRWGSCSSKGNININCKLMFLPFDLVRYLFMHELCHTIHLNHSQKYWRLLATLQPDYIDYERSLSEAMRLVPRWMQG